MLISDHTLISFEENVHSTCLYGTTRQLGPLEYALLNKLSTEREGGVKKNPKILST